MQGYEITERMRALLIDWLVQVHSRFQLLQETLYLTVAILDRFLQVRFAFCVQTPVRASPPPPVLLQVQPVSRRKLQLVGVTAMLVACKYEEMFAPDIGDFAYITDNAFTKTQILEMEQVILGSLKFQLGRPLPLHFLRRASKVANVSLSVFQGCCGRSFTGANMLKMSVSFEIVLVFEPSLIFSCQSDVERHTLAKYLMELTLLDYHMVHYRPSEVAAASLCLSQLLLEGLPWVSLLKLAIS